ncbi:hypothetical protein EDC01DRAFT_668042 [Geopyxis carbonaria]|nr:hypothetical protein EDC01DRAFT_668042 [Geopyxis carbonaria]
MAARKPIPNSWDDDDWTNTPPAAPSASAPTSPPRTLYDPSAIEFSNAQQPKTLYKPDLKILKRAGGNPRAAAAADVLNRPISTAEQRDRERKEKERRYREARDKIFNAPASTNGSAAGEGKNKRGGKKTTTTTPTGSGARTPTKAASAPPTSAPAPAPLVGGAITGFALNGAAARPVVAKQKEDWKLRQVALDGKMLESQAERYGYVADPSAVPGDGEGVGAGAGMQWDEFRRDGAWRDENTAAVLDDVEERLGGVRLDAGSRSSRGGGGSGGSPGRGNGGNGNGVGNGSGGVSLLSGPGSGTASPVVRAVRDPKGPDANAGRGFRGRGNGRRGG